MQRPELEERVDEPGQRRFFANEQLPGRVRGRSGGYIGQPGVRFVVGVE